MTSENTATGAPTVEPPGTGKQGAESDGAPTPLDTLLGESEAEMSTEAMPTLAPPAEITTEATADEGMTAWQTGKKITALWSNSVNRNSYAAVSGIGWKKFAGPDSAVISMTMMAAHAEQMNRSVNLLIEGDGKIHAIYVW